MVGGYQPNLSRKKPDPQLQPGVDYPGSNVNPTQSTLAPSPQSNVNPALSTPLPQQVLPQPNYQDNTFPVNNTDSGQTTFVDRKTALAQANRDAQTQQENQLIQQMHSQILTPEQQQRLQDISNSVGVDNQMQSQGGAAPPDILSAIEAGLGQGAIGASAGAGLGAVGGIAGGPAAPVTVPVAAGIGALTGFVGGFIRGATGKLKEQTNQNIAAEFTTLQSNAKNLRYLIIDAKKDPEGASQAFNAQLTAIDNHYVNIKSDGQNNLNKFLGVDTQVEMAKLNNFYAPGGLREIYINRMKMVLANPNTNVSDLVYASDLESAT